MNNNEQSDKSEVTDYNADPNIEFSIVSQNKWSQINDDENFEEDLMLSDSLLFSSDAT